MNERMTNSDEVFEKELDALIDAYGNSAIKDQYFPRKGDPGFFETKEDVRKIVEFEEEKNHIVESFAYYQAVATKFGPKLFPPIPKTLDEDQLTEWIHMRLTSAFMGRPILNLSNLGLTANMLGREFSFTGPIETLNLSGNQFDEYPRELCYLCPTRGIDVSKNNIGSFPHGMGGRCWNVLESLNLSKNPISEIPDCLAEIKSLRFLYLNDCKLDSLPENFRDLTNLQCLELGNNQFDEIPKVIFELPNLIYLNISGNRIRDIPEEILEATHLTHLVLENNRIREVSSQVKLLNKLTALSLYGNPLDKEDFEKALILSNRDCKVYFESPFEKPSEKSK